MESIQLCHLVVKFGINVCKSWWQNLQPLRHLQLLTQKHWSIEPLALLFVFVSKFDLYFFKIEVIDFGGSNLTPEANQLGAQLLPIINQ